MNKNPNSPKHYSLTSKLGSKKGIILALAIILIAGLYFQIKQTKTESGGRACLICKVLKNLTNSAELSSPNKLQVQFAKNLQRAVEPLKSSSRYHQLLTQPKELTTTCSADGFSLIASKQIADLIEQYHQLAPCSKNCVGKDKSCQFIKGYSLQVKSASHFLASIQQDYATLAVPQNDDSSLWLEQAGQTVVSTSNMLAQVIELTRTISKRLSRSGDSFQKDNEGEAIALLIMQLQSASKRIEVQKNRIQLLYLDGYGDKINPQLFEHFDDIVLNSLDLEDFLYPLEAINNNKRSLNTWNEGIEALGKITADLALIELSFEQLISDQVLSDGAYAGSLQALDCNQKKYDQLQKTNAQLSAISERRILCKNGEQCTRFADWQLDAMELSASSIAMKQQQLQQQLERLKNSIGESSNQLCATITPEIKLPQRKYLTGQSIKFEYRSPIGLSNDAWIGSVPSEIDNGFANTNRKNVADSVNISKKNKATLSIKVPKSPGLWQLRMNTDWQTGEELAAVSFFVESSEGELSLAKKTFVTGEQIEYVFKTSPGLNNQPWVGVIPARIKHGSAGLNDNYDVSYTYLEDSSGKLSISAPVQTGLWDLRLHDSYRGNEIASVAFEVKQARATIILSKSSYRTGENISIEINTYEALNPKAWIGLFKQSSPHGRSNKSDRYDMAYHYLESNIESNLNFKAPQQLGAYEVRVFDASNDLNGNEIASVGFKITQ